MQYIYVMAGTTENVLGILQRLAGVFTRNRINIEQFNISTTKNTRVSHFNLMIHADEKTVERVIQQLQKIIELIEVKITSKTPFITHSSSHFSLTGETTWQPCN